MCLEHSVSITNLLNTHSGKIINRSATCKQNVSTSTHFKHGNETGDQKKGEKLVESTGFCFAFLNSLFRMCCLLDGGLIHRRCIFCAEDEVLEENHFSSQWSHLPAHFSLSSTLGERVNVADEKSILNCGFFVLLSAVFFIHARWLGTNANSISPILEINLCWFSHSRVSSFQCSGCLSPRLLTSLEKCVCQHFNTVCCGSQHLMLQRLHFKWVWFLVALF